MNNFERGTNMYTTRTELKKEVRNELKCPSEFIRHLTRFDVFGDLKEAVVSDDRSTENDIMKEIRDAYLGYCRDTGLDFEQDNRKARIGFFIL